MRSYKWTLIQSGWWPCKKRRSGHRQVHTQSEKHLRTQRENDHLQAKERGLRRNQHCRHLHLRPLALPQTSFFLSLEKEFNDLFLERGEGKEKGRETTCGWLSHAPYWGPGPQRRHVPWLGIKPLTLWFTAPHPIHWATPARADSFHRTVRK